MLNYDGHTLFLNWQYNKYNILQPKNMSRNYYAHNVIGFKMDIVIYTEVGMWILMQTMQRYIPFEKHLYFCSIRR